MHKKYGINISILCSNILISYSIMCISKYNHNIIYYFGKLGINLCLGEIIDIKQNKDDNINNYINCIEKKQPHYLNYVHILDLVLEMVIKEK